MVAAGPEGSAYGSLRRSGRTEKLIEGMSGWKIRNSKFEIRNHSFSIPNTALWSLYGRTSSSSITSGSAATMRFQLGRRGV